MTSRCKVGTTIRGRSDSYIVVAEYGVKEVGLVRIEIDGNAEVFSGKTKVYMIPYGDLEDFLSK